ncbi:MAG TPA: hypothetical protein DD729_06075 [Rhodobacteraceae bacterium]|nr:hypothetical protein [Paracoccaceae bacterium]
MRATRGFVAPALIDAATQAQLDKMVTEVMASEEFKANAKTGSIFLLPMSGADYLAYLTGLQAETQAVFDKSPW